jgi:hypothetical protein
MKRFFATLVVLLPWGLKRWCLARFWKFEIDPTARIGLAWIFPRKLVMGPGSRIGHMTLCKSLSLLRLDERASIGRGNWITGFPAGPSKHFAHQPDRRPEFILERHAAITNRHLVDCTHSVTIGEFTTLAGFASQILTHSIDLEHCRQSSEPVRIGAYCFIGTNCVLLGGSSLPDRSVLGAKSLLNKAYSEPLHLYAGVPARPIKPLPADWKYFQRTDQFVY